MTISCFAVRPSRQTWKARGRKNSSADICDSRYYMKSHSRKVRSCRGGGGRCFANCRFIVFLLILFNLLWSDNCLDPAFKILATRTSAQNTHKVKWLIIKRKNSIIYFVFSELFFKPVVTLAQWLLVWVWCENNVFSTFFWTPLTVSPRFIYYSICDIVLRNLHVFMSLSSWVQQSLQQSDKSCVLGLVCCSPLKITFMLPSSI